MLEFLGFLGLPEIGIIGFILGAAAGRYFKTEDTDTLVETVFKLAEIAVRSTEQQRGDEPGVTKKEVAKMKLKTEMQEMGLNIASGVIEEAIEGAVQKMNSDK
jgi:LL-H family phage holin